MYCSDLYGDVGQWSNRYIREIWLFILSFLWLVRWSPSGYSCQEKKNHEHACKAHCSGLLPSLKRKWHPISLRAHVTISGLRTKYKYAFTKTIERSQLLLNWWGFVWFVSMLQLESACWKYQQELLHATRPTVRGIIANWWYPNKPNCKLVDKRDKLAQYTILQAFFFFPGFFLYLFYSPSSYHKFENTLCRHIQGDQAHGTSPLVSKLQTQRKRTFGSRWWKDPCFIHRNRRWVLRMEVGPQMRVYKKGTDLKEEAQEGRSKDDRKCSLKDSRSRDSLRSSPRLSFWEMFERHPASILGKYQEHSSECALASILRYWGLPETPMIPFVERSTGSHRFDRPKS